MREVLVRLGCLLFLWFGFIDLFIGPVKQLWIWTLSVIAAFFLIEGAGQLIISVYLKHTSKEG